MQDDDNEREQVDRRARIIAEPEGVGTVPVMGLDGIVVELPQFRFLGYPLPVRLEMNCRFFDKAKRACGKSGLIISSYGCWGDKCPSREGIVSATTNLSAPALGAIGSPSERPSPIQAGQADK